MSSLMFSPNWEVISHQSHQSLFSIWPAPELPTLPCIFCKENALKVSTCSVKQSILENYGCTTFLWYAMEKLENQNTGKRKCGTAAGRFIELSWSWRQDVVLDADQDLRQTDKKVSSILWSLEVHWAWSGLSLDVKVQMADSYGLEDY